MLNNWKIKITYLSDDKKYCTLLVGMYVMKVIGYFWVACIGDSQAFQLISKVIQFILLLIVIQPILKKPRLFIITEIIFICIYMLSFLQGYATSGLILDGLYYGCIMYIPMAFAALRLDDKSLLIKYYYRFAWICSILLIISSYRVFLIEKNSYDMTLGYLLLFSMLFFMYRLSKERKIADLIMSIICGLIILFCGSRGPFICIIGYIILILAFSKAISFRWKAFYIAALGAALLIVLWRWTDILNLLANVLSYLGINSRSINLIFEESAFTYTSGRDRIAELAFQLLNESPILGCGVRSLEGVYGTGVYPHNIFIEILLSFGYIVGIIVCAVLIIICIRGLLITDTEHRDILLIFLAFCLSLLVSGTFLDSWQFFVFIGLCLSGKSRLNIKIRSNYYHGIQRSEQAVSVSRG